MIRECFFAFTLIVLLNSWMLRSGIVDAYQFKRTNREKKSYETTHMDAVSALLRSIQSL